MSTISAGSRIGPYEIVAPLGAGGMGEVWRARDTRLDRSVAIKVLPAEFAQNAQLKLRFEREAKAISQLNHPNICTLYDVGDSYLVMELLDGESLADRTARGALPIAEVLKYGAQIGEALDKAHRAGIIHRDLKPGNVMITKTGAKLLDFGLASVGAAAPGGATVEATQHKPLTQEGTILGTFQYMAPEQLEGEEADARTDIFAFGAVLYEMATGKRAFEGKTRTSLIAAIVSAEPKPIRTIQPLTPPAFEHVVQKCLEKNREDRWQSAHDVAEELKWAAMEMPAFAHRKSNAWIAWSIAVILAIGAGALGYLALRPHERAQYRFTIPMIEGGFSGGFDPRLSADGRTLFFRALTADGKRQVFRRRLDELTASPVEGSEGSFEYVVAPDGRNLLLAFSAGFLKRISATGGPLETVMQMAGGGFTGAIARDGTILIGDRRGIQRVLPTGAIDALTAVDAAHGETAHVFPSFLPGGKGFLFVAITLDAARGTIRQTLCAAKLGSKEIRRIGDVPTRVEYTAGHVFFVRDGTLMARPFDTSRLAFTGDAVPVTNDVGFNSRSGAASFSVAEDGTIATRAFGFAGRPTLVDASGKKLSTVGGVTTAVSVPAILPAGDRVVLSLADLRAGLQSLWMQGLTREAATRVTFSPATESSPVVTPDGSRVFFTSDLQGGAHIYEAPLDGSTPPKLVVAAENSQIPNDVSPDGRFLLYTSNQTFQTTRQDLYILPLTGDRKPYPFLATPAVENFGTFSPDGRWIAYVSTATGTAQVYVKPFPGPGAARIVSTKGGGSPRFSPDGRKIYFSDGGKLMKADFTADGSIGEPAQMFELTGEHITAFRPMPDGNRFLMILQNDAEGSPPVRIITGWRPPA